MMASSLFSLCSQRESGFLPESIYWKATRDSDHLIKRLIKTKTLKGHSGCVNTVSWNRSGTRLISGSDDCHLNIYDTATGLVRKSVHTGHRSNIFSAKFLPSSDDLKAVSCAGIGSVEYTELTPMGDYIGHPFKCQSSITYQVVTTPFDSNEFFTCEEKGYVRLYDLRVKSSCICDGCKKDVLYTFPSSVTCMAVHPVSPFYIACGLGDGDVRLLDRRMAGSDPNSNYLSSLSPSELVERTTCKRYRPSVLGTQPHKITSIQFNDVGSELLVSYSEDYVYLYNSGLFGNSDAYISRPSYLSHMETYCPRASRRRRGEIVKRKPVGASSVEVDSENDPSSSSDPTSSEQCPPSTKKLRLRGDWSDTGPEARPKTQEEEEEGGSNLMNRMSRMFAQWIDMSLSPDSERDSPPPPPRRERLIDRFRRRRAEREREREREREQLARQGREDHRVTGESPMTSSTSSSDSSFNLFDSDTEGASHEGHKVDKADNTVPTKHEEIQKKKGDQEPCQADTQENHDDDHRMLEAAAPVENDRELESNTSPTASSITRTTELENITEERQDQQYDQGSRSIQSRMLELHVAEDSSHSDGLACHPDSVSEGQSNSPVVPTINIIEGETDSDDEGSHDGSHVRSHDLDETIEEEEQCGKGGEESNGCLQPFMVYKGHRNSRTMIKQANFLGDSWVVSGSDCGRMFVWNKWTGEIINLLIADSHVVNCIQPHPQAYLIATSGIDYNVKLWEPVAEHSCTLDDMEEVVGRNEAMLAESRNTITVPSMFVLRILAYLNRRRRMQGDDRDGASGDEDGD